MQTKVIIIVFGLFILATVGFLLYQAYALHAGYTYEQSLVEASSCNLDVECVEFWSDCGACSVDAINKKDLPHMLLQRKNHCELNPPKILCDAVFIGEIKCVDNRCVATHN